MPTAKTLILICISILIGSRLLAITPPSRVEVFFDYLKKTASETLQFNQETTDAWYDKLNNLQIKQNLQDSLDQVREMINNRESSEPDRQKAQNRNFLEQLGHMKISRDGQTLNEYARQAVDRLCPDLRGTDYFNNPGKTLSYFLMLDPCGFVENVKIIKGPLDTPMTIKEAYQYYTRTEPAKAEKILKMLESLQRLNSPDTDQDQLKIIMESVEQTIELLNHQSEP